MASYFLPIVAKGSTADNPLGIGAGPFLLANEERGVSLEFTAFDKFFRPGLPKLKSVRMVAYADENLRVAALQAGDVDLIEYVPWQSMASIEADQKLSLQTTSGPFMYLTFNAKAGPFGDARVRRAVAHAIKREDIIKAAFFGRGDPIEGLALPKGTPFYDEALAHGLAYDPAKRQGAAGRGRRGRRFQLQAAVHRAVRHAQGHRRGDAAVPRRGRHPGRAGAARLGDPRGDGQPRPVRVRGGRIGLRQQRSRRAGRRSSTAGWRLRISAATRSTFPRWTS